MKNKTTLLFVAVWAALIMGCSQMPAQIDRQAEIAAVTDAINTSIKWCLPEKDREKLYRHVAKDPAFFIFHPDSKSTIVGFDKFREHCETLFFDERFKATSSEIKDLRVNLSPDGSVAWFSCLLDDYGEWDGREIGWTNARWTGVLEKRDGVWLMMQQHFSLPTDAGDES